MNTIEFITQQLKASEGMAMTLLNDMRDLPLAQPSQNGGNHALWILGHIVFSESTLLDGFIHGKPNRFPEWQLLFGIGSTPLQDADDYPTFDAITGRFNEVRNATLNYIAALADADLDTPSQAPAELVDYFPTVGRCLGSIVSHAFFHAGQVAVVRNAVNRPPLMG